MSAQTLPCVSKALFDIADNRNYFLTNQGRYFFTLCVIFASKANNSKRLTKPPYFPLRSHLFQHLLSSLVSFSPAFILPLLAIGQHLIDQPVLLGLHRRHDPVAFDIPLDRLK